MTHIPQELLQDGLHFRGGMGNQTIGMNHQHMSSGFELSDSALNLNIPNSIRGTVESRPSGQLFTVRSKGIDTAAFIQEQDE